MQILESLDKFPRVEIPDKVFGQPIIKQQLQSIDDVPVAQLVRFECHIEPTNDCHLVVEWLHNEKPIQQGTPCTVLLHVIYTFLSAFSVPVISAHTHMSNYRS